MFARNAVIASAIVGILSVAARADFPPPSEAPVFFNTPGIMTFAINPPTVTGFSFNGYARDPQANETVTIFPISISPLFEFSSTPGNPASFTITARGLDSTSIGRRYTTDIGAVDNAVTRHYGTIQIEVYVVLPEPSAVIGVGSFLIAAVRRRR